MSSVADGAGPSLTIWERLQIAGALSILPFALIYGQFKEANKRRSYLRALYEEVARFIGNRGWTLRQYQALVGSSTTKVYDGWVKSKKLNKVTDELEGGGKLHWIGPRNYDRVLLYSHGGGYCFSSAPTLPDFLLSIKSEVDKAGKLVGVIMLEYPLMPTAFPAQLRCINAAVQHLISNGTSPSKIVLGGDSAGANLDLQFLSHVLHPYPNIPPPPSLSSPLGGALLISPWVTFEGERYTSWQKNAKADNMTPAFLKFMTDTVTAGLPKGKESWFEPARPDESWWNGLDGKVRRVLCTVGEVECWRDPIVEFVTTRLKPNVEEVTLLEEKNGTHINAIVEFSTDGVAKSEAYWKTVSWLAEIFKD